MKVFSWGRAATSQCDWQSPAHPLHALPATPHTSSQLARGLGRSYGDSNLNTDGTLISTQQLDRFIAFNDKTGLLRAQAGVSLHSIIQTFLPRGWFLPVTPGSRYITLGGAVANDVHGKNHHLRGCFGNHVTQFELVRSDGVFICSPEQNQQLFAATIGGLGLTGFINWVELTLMPVTSSYVTIDEYRFGSLAELYRLDEQLAPHNEYTVAWFDCMSYGSGALRGIFSAGNHATPAELPSSVSRAFDLTSIDQQGPTLPFAPPISPINQFTLTAFNALYANRPLATQPVDLVKFMYPLDAIGQWNRMYGRAGFYQYQCVVPAHQRDALSDMLRVIKQSGQGSFLAVLKRFGDLASPGLMSFPMPGYTLALDFPNRGERMLKLFTQLDAILSTVGGRLYPAKDGAMNTCMFRSGYPQWQQLEALRDPKINSDFWRRVNL
jgi:FAD/FMN-containing dehydrogenase